MDVRAQQLPEQRRHALHRLGWIDQAGRQDLLSAEGQQLAREAGRALGRLLDLIELEAHVAGRPVAIDCQPGKAQDCGEQVVEVVGDAAGQPADRFHLLRLLQLPLDGLPDLALFPRLAPQLGVAELPVDGRGEAGEVVLEHVVVSAGAHRLDGGLLADRARHDDEGVVDLAGLDG
jgi:hypothetical protein